MGPGMGMGHRMGMMGKGDCDRDDMRGMGMMEHRHGFSSCEEKKMDDACDRGGKGGGMGMMGMTGMTGKKGGGMGGMESMGGMGGMKDDATAARLDSLEKRLDMLQEMMKMMMEH